MKLASVCSVLATSVRLRVARSVGSSGEIETGNVIDDKFGKQEIQEHTVRDVKQAGRQNRRTQEPQEYRGAYQIVRHILAVQLLQALPERGETVAQLRGKVYMRLGNARPRHAHRIAQRLLLSRQRAGRLQRIHLAVPIRCDHLANRRRQRVLQILFAGQLQERLHALRRQRIAAERQPLIVDAQQIQRHHIGQKRSGHTLRMHQQHQRLSDILLRLHANHRLQQFAHRLVIALQVRQKIGVRLDRQNVRALEATADPQRRHRHLRR